MAFSKSCTATLLYAGFSISQAESFLGLSQRFDIRFHKSRHPRSVVHLVPDYRAAFITDITPAKKKIFSYRLKFRLYVACNVGMVNEAKM